MPDQRELLGDLPETLREFVVSLGQPAYRGGQIFGWLHRGIPFAQMSNLPRELREALAAEAVDFPMTIAQNYESQQDETVKFLFQCLDGNVVEGVLMRYHYGYTLCISTQIGCKMGCAFCASTQNGCVRNLTAGEMLCQIILTNRYLGDRGKVGHVVLMGSGEPLDNYENVIQFLKLVNHPAGINIGMRSISLSTCGIVPKIDRLAGEGLGLTLSVSLHAPNDEIRRQIMPIAKLYSMDALMASVRRYCKQTGRRILIEYAMIDGLNAAPAQALELAKLLSGLQSHVNLIALNPVKESPLKPATPQAIRQFQEILEEKGVSVTTRREMGRDLDGACGQLRNHYLKEQTKADII